MFRVLNCFLRWPGNNCSPWCRPWWGSYASAAHGAAEITLQLVKNFMSQKGDVPQGGCDPMGSLHWNKLIGRTCGPMNHYGTMEHLCSWRTALHWRDQHCSSSWRTAACGNNLHWRSLWRTVHHGRDPLLEQGMTWGRLRGKDSWPRLQFPILCTAEGMEVENRE